MTDAFPIVPGSSFTERQGVHYVGYIASQIGIVWREVTNTDLGIDGYLEVIVNGAPIGLIAVQVKSGQSYFQSPDNTSFVFRAEKKHVRYWLSYRLPVIVVIYEPEERIAYWHYIQDYFIGNDEVPNAESVPIRISKTDVFNILAKDRLAEIAAYPDSTAHAMLALRASRYREKQELLTSIELIELYGKRKWLGEWLPLDREREQILLHSSIAKRGPAWYWFRADTNRSFVPHLKSALQHPDYLLRTEAALALASTIGREAVADLENLINIGYNIIEVGSILASLTNLTEQDRERIINILWNQLHIQQEWPRNIVLELLSIIAQLGGSKVQEKVVASYYSLEAYAPSTSPLVPQLLKNAHYLWSNDHLPELRKLLVSSDRISKALAAVALAQIGEYEDLKAIVNYIVAEQWPIHEERFWLARKTGHLFTSRDLIWLKELLNGDYGSQCVASSVLPVLCLTLSEEALLEMLNEPIIVFKINAIEGLVAIGNPEILKKHKYLLTSTDISLRRMMAIGLTATGDWEEIDQLLQIDDFGLHEGVAEGLRYVKHGPVFETLLKLVDDSEANLKACESLALIGDENMLQSIVDWLIKHPYDPNADIMKDILIHLDRRQYCPIEWASKMERDFSNLRYSVRRYE